MSLAQTTALYVAVLTQLLPEAVYDAAPTTVLQDDIYAHAKLLAQTDLDAHRLLQVLESIPVELLNDYEREYGLPLKCMVSSSLSIAERIEILRWVRTSRNVMNRAYFDLIFKLFNVEVFEFQKYKPMQCTASCTDAVNTEQLRYKVRIVIPDTAPADINCIIQNYFPGYLRIDVLKVPLLFKTSKPYPAEVIESIAATVSVKNTKLTSDVGYNNEEIKSSLKVTGISLIDSVSYIANTAETEEIRSSLKVTGITLDTYKVNTSIDNELIKAAITVNSIQMG